MNEAKRGYQPSASSVASAAEHLAGLNPHQRRAVTHGIKPGKAKDVGPLLVIAGAGSGKTKTIAHRVAHLLANPRDRVAGFRVLQLLPGIGPSTAAKILDKIAAERKVVAVLKRFAVPNQTAEDWPAFVSLIGHLRKAKIWPAEFEPLRAWYEPHLQRLYDDAEARAADIAQLQQIAAGYASRERFLTELTLDPPDATGGHGRATLPDEDYTILSTIHSAKGGEWEIVRILNVVDGCIPLAMATRTSEEIEEERRLLHVAMTRSKDELDLIVPQRMFTYQHNDHGDRHVYARISRFIPKSIHDALELQHWNERPSKSITGPSKSHSKRIDVAASIEQMWQ